MHSLVKTTFFLFVTGNNIFGEDIVKTLTETVDVRERSKFILMDKIQPPIKQNYIVRAELAEPVLADVLSEIGCFGILIRLVRAGFFFRSSGSRQ